MKKERSIIKKASKLVDYNGSGKYHQQQGDTNVIDYQSKGKQRTQEKIKTFNNWSKISTNLKQIQNDSTQLKHGL